MEHKSMYSQDRNVLKDCVPLSTPYVIHLELTSHCNIQCEYCIHSEDREAMQQKGHIFGSMSEDILERIYEDLSKFPVPVKKVVLGGIGEPTLHRGLPQTVFRIKNASPETKISIITNGIMLAKALSDELINNGADEIKVSLQGLSSDDYLGHCRAKINFEQFLKNLQYLYEHKSGDMKIYVKIPSAYLTPETKQRYYDVFSDKCDYISTENLTNCFDLENDKLKHLDLNDDRFNIKHGDEIAAVCAIPFYRINVLCNGDISLCNACRHIGFLTDENILNYEFTEIWNGLARKNFLLDVLRGATGDIPHKCRNCFARSTFASEADNLDDSAEEIYKKIEAL